MADNWFQLIIKWLFMIIGIPKLAEILLRASIEHTFQTATTIYQIFIGFVFVICLIFYLYFGIWYLIKETKEFFN